MKWTLVGLGALVASLAAVVAFLVATFDPSAYTPRLVELVKRETGRTLAIDGKISVIFFPKIGAAVGRITLSEPHGPAVFARVEDAHVAVALWPLLSRQVVVDRVTLKGLAVDLVRYKDGRTNFDDLTGRGRPAAEPGAPPRPAREGAPFAVDVSGIDIEGATVGWRDERDGTDVRLENVRLESGRLASGVPGKLALAAHVQGTRPAARLDISLDSGYRIDFGSQAVALSSLDAKVTGDVPGLPGIDARARGAAVELDPVVRRVSASAVEVTVKTKDGLDARATIPKVLIGPDRTESQAMSVDVALATPPRTVNVKLAIPAFSVAGAQVDLSQVGVDLAAEQPGLSVRAKLATPVTLDLDARRAKLTRLAGTLLLAGQRIPADTRAVVGGSARADWGAQDAAADLTVKLGESSIDAKVAVRHWSSPAIAFDVAADRLDVDRYLATGPAAPPSGRPPSVAPAARPAPGGGSAPPAEAPADLSALRTLDAAGTVKIGALRIGGVKADRVALTIRAARGRLQVDPMSANLYEGTLAGSVVVDAGTNGVAVKQRLAEVSVGPLLRDAGGKDVLEGRGAVVLDVTSRGTTTAALRKALAGSGTAALRDGSIKGVDIVAIIGTAQTLLGSRRTLDQEARGGARTDFSEMTGSFTIRNGVARNDDLVIKSSLVRIAGRGDIDVGEGTLDYTASASLTPAAGLAGRDLARLVGVAVPVRATGLLASPTYTVDVGGLATELAKGAVQRELQRRLGGDKPDGKTGGGDVGDLLRGLFGKPK